MIIKNMSTEEIKKQMQEKRILSELKCTWLHQDKRYIALLNEYERRC